MNQFVKVDRKFTITKALSEDGTFEGYASVFDIEDHSGDTVRKGAFKKGLEKAIKEKRTLKMLWNHDRYQPIGKYTDASEDDKGLWVAGKLTLGVQKADETRLLMLDDAVDSMSIGGYVIKELWDNKTGKRDLLQIELREISPVTFPALDAARITAVKSISDIGDLPELERYLRDVGGFSTKDAKAIISKAKAATPQRDVDGAVGILKAAIHNLVKE
jgi:HK97 family phage prohead protease